MKIFSHRAREASGIPCGSAKVAAEALESQDPWCDPTFQSLVKILEPLDSCEILR